MAGSAAALALIVDPACRGAFDGWLFGFYAIAFGAVVSSIFAGAAVGVLVRSTSVGVICAVLAFASHYVLIPMIWD